MVWCVIVAGRGWYPGVVWYSIGWVLALLGCSRAGVQGVTGANVTPFFHSVMPGWLELCISQDMMDPHDISSTIDYWISQHITYIYPMALNSLVLSFDQVKTICAYIETTLLIWLLHFSHIQKNKGIIKMNKWAKSQHMNGICRSLTMVSYLMA